MSEKDKLKDLAQASFEGDLDLVRSLVEAGANVDEMGRNWNPLHASIEGMQTEVLRYLLASGADKEYMCSGMRPLHHAIDIEIDAATQENDSEYPEPKLTEILIDSGANINGEDSEGITPMQMAKRRGHKEAEKLLQSKSAT